MNLNKIKDKNLNDLLSGLSSAIENIEREYFKLNLASEDGKDHFKYRERVYCYELYHQIRKSLGADYPYVISGEVDKRDHPIITSNKNPDFVIHNPGNMKENFVIMEVKNLTNFNNTKGKKDIKTFMTFFEECNYQYAIYLIYGEKENKNKFQENRKKLKRKIKEELSKNEIKNKIVFVLWHNKVKNRPENDIISLPKTRKIE